MARPPAHIEFSGISVLLCYIISLLIDQILYRTPICHKEYKRKLSKRGRFNSADDDDNAF